AACGCWHVSDAHLDSPRGQNTNPAQGCLLKRSVAASDTWSSFILHLPLDIQNSEAKPNCCLALGVSVSNSR
ncbi:hypothetical protein HispidOSU_004501, partial [Sigmodon hispidus]